MKTTTTTGIKRKAETLLEHHSEIEELLIRKLSIADAARLMRQFTQGSGDYTAERHQWLGALSLEDIKRDIKENAGKSRLSRGKKPDSSVVVASVGAARDEVEQLLKKDQRDGAVQVAEYVLRHEVSGSPEDFQRFGALLAEAGLHRLAAKIVLDGLQCFPKNLPLLSSGIEHLKSIGDVDTLRKAEERYQILQLLGTRNQTGGSPKQEKTQDTWQKYSEYLNRPEYSNRPGYLNPSEKLN
uniref:Uncharacterized protein n=1 Tax=Candidatus Kentrum sp. FW TaxID=2126338 RepID=A0A450TI32_9GAMM|nr:MAG: hypothetical protein BECKFW1821C_GA0114237_101083 [Candidatus Kentron sp. FW]